MKSILYVAFAVFLLGGCCAKNGKPGLLCLGNPDIIVSPNRIPKTPNAAFEKKVKKLKHFTLCQKPSGCEIIGHGAGSFRHYAMQMNRDGTIEGNNKLFYKYKVVNVTELIKNAFQIQNIDAVEIDVHVPPKSIAKQMCYPKNECAFVMHNRPIWEVLHQGSISPNAYEYLQQNRLESILSDFFHESYTNKKIYIELKAPHNCMLPDIDETSCKREPKIIANIINKISKENEVAEHLAVASFSATYLQTFYHSVDQKVRHSIEYVLIAGYKDKGIKRCFADCKGAVPPFSCSMQNFIVDTQWLNTVWFSTKAIDDPKAAFEYIVAAREKKGYKKLSFSVSHYDKRDVLEILLKNSFFTLKSIMIDIDE